MSDQISTINVNEGVSISVVGDTYRIIMPGEQTGGAYAVIDMLVPPGGGPGPHAHADIQELFYVVDGEIEFQTEAGKYLAKKGSFVNIPKGGQVHCFKNFGTETAHMLCTVIPSGLDAFFMEIGTPVATGEFLPPPVLDENELKRLISAAEKHGQKLFPPDYFDKKS
ncbi:Cupin domain-containing protein [Mucilaginibacter pineti]|uniref:Cupin domain-containing protein n=1 Tax=Mucilaginibacter pineti TaxID=1391627 RepID=A0A1G6UEY5_9SPHI|nr:cupin domain-containing protein [Mucilaginibacter pineti]SDD39157.1 Cupin domain-containing protein [Mucilaginibacter pineti]